MTSTTLARGDARKAGRVAEEGAHASNVLILCCKSLELPCDLFGLCLAVPGVSCCCPKLRNRGTGPNAPQFGAGAGLPPGARALARPEHCCLFGVAGTTARPVRPPSLALAASHQIVCDCQCEHQVVTSRHAGSTADIGSE